jgi:hypothetical protein
MGHTSCVTHPCCAKTEAAWLGSSHAYAYIPKGVQLSSISTSSKFITTRTGSLPNEEHLVGRLVACHGSAEGVDGAGMAVLGLQLDLGEISHHLDRSPVHRQGPNCKYPKAWEADI